MIRPDLPPCPLVAGWRADWTPREPLILRTAYAPAVLAARREAACLSRKQPRDITGQRFGLLVALGRDHSRGRGYWTLRCDCGDVVSRTSDGLRESRRPSCNVKGRHR